MALIYLALISMPSVVKFFQTLRLVHSFKICVIGLFTPVRSSRSLPYKAKGRKWLMAYPSFVRSFRGLPSTEAWTNTISSRLLHQREQREAHALQLQRGNANPASEGREQGRTTVDHLRPLTLDSQMLENGSTQHFAWMPGSVAEPL